MANTEISKIIEEKTKIIAEAVVDRQYKLQPEVWERYGEKGRELSVRDVGYHLPYLTEAITATDPSMFVNYVLWVKELFAGLNFPDTVLPVTLECMRDTLKDHLPPEMTEITTQYIEAGLEKLEQSSLKETTFIPDESLHAELARTYLNYLLQGKRHEAAALILDAVEKGTRIQDIYLHVFQASQYEIGRLWHTKQVSVAQEHYCSAATERIMSQLYAKIFTTERIGRGYVGACVGGELHQIGARMVADFFEMEGWDTYYMGANTPAQSILQAISEHNAHVLGISCTMSFHRSGLEELIKSVRASEDAPKDLKIIVGGYSFIQKPELWKEVGADGSAKDAKEAIALAGRLLN
jgi:methanogenic corrinoid protein MtbC1